MAGIWFSVILGMILVFLTIGVVAASGNNSGKANVKDDSILHLSLNGSIVDRATPRNLIDEIYGTEVNTLNLNDIVDAIAAAKDDGRIKGIYLECGGVSIGLAQAQTMIKALEDFKTSGKWVYSYADTYTQGGYYIAAVSDSLFVNPIGMVDVHGLSSTTVYFKDLLEKIGVEVQVVKVGTYKSAVEPFILSGMSEANKEQQEHFLGNIWGYMKEKLAKRRSVPADSIESWADGFAFARKGTYYIKSHIVDGLKYRHQMEKMLADITGKEKKPSLVNYKEYLTASESPLKKQTASGKNIAVLYALGDITESGREGITSDRLVPVILELAENEKIDGLILRVNSGGGSAYASEQIWEALEQFKSISKKPFYVSMSDMAASGGYYISCGANKIYAEPLTLTGSIGIFGLIPNIQPLLKDKLGVNTATVSTNSGSFPTIMEPMSEQQHAAMQSYVDNGYELFVSRCAKGRKKTVEQIKNIAEGRVWDGQSALKNGLIDKLGGLDMALADMAKELGAESYYITEYPEVKSKWWEMLVDMDSEMQMSVNGNELSAAYQSLKTIRKVKDMHPLQCRTDYIRLH